MTPRRRGTDPTDPTGAPGPSADDPVLAELRRRYAAVDSPMTSGSPRWNARHPPSDLDLGAFRADSVFLWQVRDGYAGPNPRQTYRRYAHFLRRIDHRRLLDRLGEDGAFGAVAIPHPDPPLLSRDLLDSVNELCFLDRRWHLFDRPGLTVLDIGAGYGRLAHRMVQAVPPAAPLPVRRCDPRSHVPLRLVLAPPACRRQDRGHPTRPLDRTPRRHPRRSGRQHPQLHRDPRAAIAAWLDLLDHLGVPDLYVIPNHSTRLHSYEPGGQRHDMRPELHRRGYILVADEPFILDDALRASTRWTEHHLLYRRSGPPRP